MIASKGKVLAVMTRLAFYTDVRPLGKPIMKLFLLKTSPDG